MGRARCEFSTFPFGTGSSNPVPWWSASGILVEGGGITVSRFLQAGALDRLHVSVASLIIGSGRPSITLPPVDTLDDALRPPVRHFTLGTDLLFDVDLGAEPG